jgi:hypothetical protein
MIGTYLLFLESSVGDASPVVACGRRDGMLLTTDQLDRRAFELGTGWKLEPEGACRGDVCVALPGDAFDDARVDVASVADRLGMPIVRHADALAALGPATFGGHALASATAPDLVLPDLEGRPFDLASLRGEKIVLVAWSPY